MLEFASPQHLSPAFARAELLGGLSDGNSKHTGGWRAWRDPLTGLGGRLRNTGCDTAPLSPPSSPAKLLLPLTVLLLIMARAGADSAPGTAGTRGTEPGPLSLQRHCSRYPHKGRARPQQTLLSISRCCQGTTPRESIGRMQNAMWGGSTCFAWLSLCLCFDSNPAAEGQGARHVRCAGQHVIPGVFWTGNEGSRLSIHQPDRYRDSLGKVGFVSRI